MTRYVTALALLIGALASGAEHGPASPASREHSVDRKKFLKSFTIAKGHYDYGPDTRQTALTDFQPPQLDLLKKTELTPEWRATLSMVTEVLAELANEYPEMMKDKLPYDFSVVDETRFERGSGGIYPQHLTQRNLLKHRLLYQIWQKEIPARMLKDFGVQYAAFDRAAAQLLATTHLKSLNGLSGTVHDPKPGLHAIPEKIGSYALSLRNSQFYKKDYPRVGEFLQFRAEKYRLDSEMRGRDPNLIEPAGIAASVSSFLNDYSEQGKDREVFSRFHDFLSQALRDRKYYRQGVLEDRKGEPFASYTAILDGFEEQLPEAKRSVFRRLRSTYHLDSPRLQGAEHRYAHSQLYPSGDEGSRVVSWTKEANPRVYSTLPVGERSRQKALAKASQDLHQSGRDPEAALRRVIDGNDFAVGRGIVGYAERLGPEALDAIAALKSGDQWIDMGSGEGFAIEEYFTHRGFTEEEKLLIKEADRARVEKALQRIAERPLPEKTKVVGVTKIMERKNSPAMGGKLTHFKGRYLEEIPDKEIGQAKLITDVFGVMAYAPKIDEVLDKYSRLLTPDGMAYFTGLAQTKVKTKSGKELPLNEWVETAFPGKAKASGAGNLVIFGGKKIWPRLKLLTSDDGSPPKRVYQEVDMQRE